MADLVWVDGTMGGGDDPPRTPEKLMEDLTTGDQGVRMMAATELHLPLEGMWWAADDPDEEVAKALLTNPEVPEAVVVHVRGGHPELHLWAMSHPNAPAPWKEAVPVAWLAGWALQRYAEQRGWSPEQHEELLHAVNAVADPFTTTLGEVVAP